MSIRLEVIIIFLAAAAVIGCGMSPVPFLPPITKPAPEPEPAPDEIQLLLYAHNRERGSLPPLKLEPRLQAAARGHADHMALVGKMAHSGIGDGDLGSRIAGYPYSRAGENIASGQPDVIAVMNSWMNSPGHKANILGDYTEVGMAHTKGYWCVDFGAPRSLGASDASSITIGGKP